MIDHSAGGSKIKAPLLVHSWSHLAGHLKGGGAGLSEACLLGARSHSWLSTLTTEAPPKVPIS